MKTTDLFRFNRSAERINESIEKTFGQRLNLESFDLHKLEDARNKLRTQIHDARSQSGFNENVENEAMTKAQWMLDAINAEIAEREEFIADAGPAEVEEGFSEYRDMFDDWMSSEFAPYKDMAGDDRAVMQRAEEFLQGQVPEDEISDVAEILTNMFHGEEDEDEGGETDDNYALASAGFGSDEDYGDFGRDESVQQGDEDTQIREGSAHGYNVVKWYNKNNDQPKLTKWLRTHAGLPKDAPLYFDDADLVYGEETIVPDALVDTKLKFNDLLDAVIDASGSTVPKFQKTPATHYRRPGLEFGSGQGKEFGPWTKESVNTGEGSDFVKGVKRLIKGKKNPSDVRDAHLAKATFGDESDKDKDKEEKRYDKVQKLISKESTQGESMSNLREGEVQQASAIVTAKTMVDRVSRWIEELSSMENDTLLQLGDSIRDEMGQEQAKGFISSVAPAIQQALENLKSTRETMATGVRQLTGEEQGAEMLGAEPGADMGGEEEMGPVEPDAMNAGGEELGGDDEFAAAEPAAGMGDAGREQRESIDRSSNLLRVLAG